jgi:hypothetical protein
MIGAGRHDSRGPLDEAEWEANYAPIFGKKQACALDVYVGSIRHPRRSFQDGKKLAWRKNELLSSTARRAMVVS